MALGCHPAWSRPSSRNLSGGRRNRPKRESVWDWPFVKRLSRHTRAESGRRTGPPAAPALHSLCRWATHRRSNRKLAWSTPRSNLVSLATSTIVVVEDDREIRRFVRLALE